MPRTGFGRGGATTAPSPSSPSLVPSRSVDVIVVAVVARLGRRRSGAALLTVRFSLASSSLPPLPASASASSSSSSSASPSSSSSLAPPARMRRCTTGDGAPSKSSSSVGDRSAGLAARLAAGAGVAAGDDERTSGEETLGVGGGESRRGRFTTCACAWLGAELRR